MTINHRPEKQIKLFIYNLIFLIISSSYLGYAGSNQDSVSVKKFASEFMRSRLVSEKSEADRKSDDQLKLIQVYVSADSAKNRLYGFTIESGGYIFAIDTDTSVIIPAYSLSGSFDPSRVNPALRAFIRAYESSEISISKNTQSLAKGSVSPLLEKEGINWNQLGVYNDACPWDAAANKHALAGCVAVAMGQILRYHKYPASGTGSYSYNHPVYGILTADFGNTVYNWNNMPGTLTSANSDVATLLYHAGVSVDMYYTPSESGASSSKVAPALINYFKYSNPTYVDNDNFAYGTNEYQVVLREELNNNRPFYYEVTGDPSHAVVCDGYTDEYFHINFGWGGFDNGYFLISDIKPAGGHIFGFKGNAVIGISPVPVSVNIQDSLALVSIYNSTDGPNWYYKNNWLSGRLNSWQFVDVINGRVLHLNLNDNNLKGTIPVEVGNLENLTNLSISGNYKLEGTIPATIGKLKNLINLSFGGNRLTGGIPPELESCSNLLMLTFSGNKLTGSIPDAIGQLTKMEYLALNGNQFSGSIPAGIINLIYLKNLNLSNNKLTGTLPEYIGNLTMLKDLRINYNQFSGQLPESVWNLSNLENFAIDNNKFEGAISPGIGAFTKLIMLNLNNNNFTSLPPEIGLLTKLSSLTAENNKIAGILPSSIGGLTKLTHIKLTNNLLTGLPAEIGSLALLQNLQLGYNLIEDLPAEIGKLTALEELVLTSNKLSEIPYEIGAMYNLINLAADSNKITGLTFGFSLVKKLGSLKLSYNNISGPLPPLSHHKLSRVFIDHNNLSFEDIASAGLADDVDYFDNYDFYYRYQRSLTINKKEFRYALNDSIGIDIRELAGLSHPGNNYTWYKNGSEHSTGPLLLINKAILSSQGYYYCSIENNQYTKLTLFTDTLRISIGVEDLAAADTIFSKSGSPLRISDKTVKLIKPYGLRGDLIWQASLDTVNWVNLSGTISNPVISQNISKIYIDSLILTPQKTALYRYKISEGDCDPVFSDTLIIGPFKSHLIIDTLLNVDNKTVTVTTDGIEITIPEGLTKGDFRLTINLVETAPSVPDSIICGPVYDVKLSCGSEFPIPLTIKLKVESDSLLPELLSRFLAVSYNDTESTWSPYAKGSVSLHDRYIVFETDHLTKLTYWEKKTTGNDFTDKFVKNGVTVYYKYKLSDIMGLYDKNQTNQSWHLPSADLEFDTPLMVQDAAHFTEEVMTRFKALGLPVPDEISIYLDNIDDYGVVGLMGMLNGYLTISVYIEEVNLLKSVLAHEYMHFTQDYYISAHAGNIFWMEANGHIADRMVWDETKLPVSESEHYLLDSRKGNNSIFESLANSWDYWDSGLLTQNLFGNVHFSYLAGCFIHYMRSYRPGTLLKPQTLLKETSWTGSWKDYLNSYITSNLGSDIGEEYEEYVKYIISGRNSDFTVLNNSPAASGDALRYLNQASGDFSRKNPLKIPEDLVVVEPQEQTITATVPYLASRMEQFYNLSLNRSLCVSYKRLHSDTANMKVYLAIWDNVNRRMNLTDISRRDSSYFFIEAATPENIEVKANQAFLLFINKSDDKSIEAGYDLEILPVADFNFLYTLDFSYGTTFDAPIHNFSDDIKRRIIMTFTSTDYTIDKSYTDSTFTTFISRAGQTQEVYYNFRNGDLVLTENRTWSGPISFDPAGRIYFQDTEQTIIKLKDIFLVPFSSAYVSMGSGVYFKQTSSTSETISKVVSISQQMTSVYDYADSNTSTNTYNYTGTQWSISQDIRLNLQFK
jgi:Leucine-rich repeat (LRR) protein